MDKTSIEQVEQRIEEKRIYLKHSLEVYRECLIDYDSLRHLFIKQLNSSINVTDISSTINLFKVFLDELDNYNGRIDEIIKQLKGTM